MRRRLFKYFYYIFVKYIQCVQGQKYSRILKKAPLLILKQHLFTCMLGPIRTSQTWGQPYSFLNGPSSATFLFILSSHTKITIFSTNIWKMSIHTVLGFEHTTFRTWVPPITIRPMSNLIKLLRSSHWLENCLYYVIRVVIYKRKCFMVTSTGLQVSRTVILPLTKDSKCLTC